MCSKIQFGRILWQCSPDKIGSNAPASRYEGPFAEFQVRPWPLVWTRNRSKQGISLPLPLLIPISKGFRVSYEGIHFSHGTIKITIVFFIITQPFMHEKKLSFNLYLMYYYFYIVIGGFSLLPLSFFFEFITLTVPCNKKLPSFLDPWFVGPAIWLSSQCSLPSPVSKVKLKTIPVSFKI